MKALLQIGYFAFSPVLMVVYWRNTMKQMDDIHASFNIEVE